MKIRFTLFLSIFAIALVFSSCKQDQMFSLKHKYKLNKVYIGNEAELASKNIEKQKPLDNKVGKQDNKKLRLAATFPKVLKQSTSNTAFVKGLKKKVRTDEKIGLKDNLLISPVTRKILTVAKKQTDKSKSLVDPMTLLVWILIILGVFLILRLLNIDLLQILGAILIILLILILLKYLV